MLDIFNRKYAVYFNSLNRDALINALDEVGFLIGPDVRERTKGMHHGALILSDAEVGVIEKDSFHENDVFDKLAADQVLYQIKYLHKLRKAWADGKIIQWSDGDNWSDYTNPVCINFFRHKAWRIKPKTLEVTRHVVSLIDTKTHFVFVSAFNTEDEAQEYIKKRTKEKHNALLKYEVVTYPPIELPEV